MLESFAKICRTSNVSVSEEVFLKFEPFILFWMKMSIGIFSWKFCISVKSELNWWEKKSQVQIMKIWGDENWMKILVEYTGSLNDLKIAEESTS